MSNEIVEHLSAKGVKCGGASQVGGVQHGDQVSSAIDVDARRINRRSRLQAEVSDVGNDGGPVPLQFFSSFTAFVSNGILGFLQCSYMPHLDGRLRIQLQQLVDCLASVFQPPHLFEQRRLPRLVGTVYPAVQRNAWGLPCPDLPRRFRLSMAGFILF